MSPRQMTLAQRVQAVAPHYENCATVNELQVIYKKTYDLRGAIRDGLNSDNPETAFEAKKANIALRMHYWRAYRRVENKRVA